VTVLDEADHMADMGFLPEVTAILEDTAPTGQRLLYSATLDGDVDTLVRRFMHDPVRHSIVDSKEAVATMEHLVLQVPPNAKYQTAARIAARDGRTLVFVRTKLAADRVAAQLREAGVLACSLHGGKSQHERNSVLEGFKNGTVPVLVATDVAARGIHVDDIKLVLQVDPAGDSKDYLHRSGRTARAGGHGTVLTLVLPHQRREVERLTTGAGVSATWHQMHRDDDTGRQMVDALTGGHEPSGIGVAEPRLRTERRGAPNRGPRRPAGSGGGYRGNRDAEHGRPAEHGQHRRGSSDRARQGDRQY
jgi:superfamily II DNA/RNA helicase